jgi:hypothetical protein
MGLIYPDYITHVRFSYFPSGLIGGFAIYLFCNTVIAASPHGSPWGFVVFRGEYKKHYKFLLKNILFYPD